VVNEGQNEVDEGQNEVDEGQNEVDEGQNEVDEGLVNDKLFIKEELNPSLS
jgi:hypothetical protein